MGASQFPFHPSLPWASACRHTPITPPLNTAPEKRSGAGWGRRAWCLSNYQSVHVRLMFYVCGSLSAMARLVCSFQGGVSGRGQDRSGCLFPSALTGKLRSWMEALFFGCSSRIKGRAERALGIHLFPLHVSSSGTAPLLGCQRHCSQQHQKDECYIHIFRNIFNTNNFWCPKCY